MLTDLCSPDPCQNGGRCYTYSSANGDMRSGCDCYMTKVFSGPTCEGK